MVGPYVDLRNHFTFTYLHTYIHYIMYRGINRVGQCSECSGTKSFWVWIVIFHMLKILIRNAGMIRSVMVYIRPGTLSRAVPELLVG